MSFEDEHKIETYKSLISISTEAFKALQYLNGGAVLAVLTYLGQITSPSASALACIKLPIGLFLVGLVAATLVYLTSYATQLTLHNENIGSRSDGHETWLYISIGLCLLSVLAFCAGAFFSLDALIEIANNSL